MPDRASVHRQARHQLADEVHLGAGVLRGHAMPRDRASQLAQSRLLVLGQPSRRLPGPHETGARAVPATCKLNRVQFIFFSCLILICLHLSAQLSLSKETVANTHLAPCTVVPNIEELSFVRALLIILILVHFSSLSFSSSLLNFFRCWRRPPMPTSSLGKRRAFAWGKWPSTASRRSCATRGWCCRWSSTCWTTPCSRCKAWRATCWKPSAKT